MTIIVRHSFTDLAVQIISPAAPKDSRADPDNTHEQMPHSPKPCSPWLVLDSLPEPLSTVSFVLEPLEEKHAELDFLALMSCRVRLREELQWSGWPPEDFSLELNRADLCRHHGEFLRCETIAYTVLSPDRSQCLGCVYIEHCAEIEGAQLTFWVIDDAIKNEAVLLTDVLAWIHQDWSINRVLVPLREANRRGILLAQNLRLATLDSVQEEALANHRCFISVK